MTRIAPVHLAFNPKTLWFDAGELEIEKTDFVVVETARGVELGHMASEVFEADEEQLAHLKSELRPVRRVASEEDLARGEEMEARSKEAMHTFKELAAEYNENMRPVAVEYLLEGDKAVFYFEAEERLDFRDIVRELASRFHVRIDMRQIGIRDEARMIGGIGHCGQELCCKRLGGEFCPVSIRMAKEQDLSLNPQKISGVCGRLMCCLRYEYEAYKDFHSRAPKQNATIQTPDGPAKVCNLDVPREIVDMKIEIDGKTKTIHVPLADMDEPEEGSTRPKSVSEEAWRRAVEPPMASFATALFLTSQFTGSDKLGDARAVRRNNANVKNATGSTSMVEIPQKSSSRRRRSRTAAGATTSTPTTTRVRRRRSTTVSADGETTVTKEVETAATDAPKSEKPASRRRRSRGGQRRNRSVEGVAASEGAEGATSRPSRRPGQKSSSLSQAHEADTHEADVNRGEDGRKSGASRHRRRRRSSQGCAQGKSQQEGGGEAKREGDSDHREAASGQRAGASNHREGTSGQPTGGERHRRRRSHHSGGKKEGESSNEA